MEAPIERQKVPMIDEFQTVFIITSTVTRLGSVLLLIFGVRILVMLYKYNVRLAAFYSAQADALEFVGTDDVDEFSKLVAVLSPDHLDFEATPGVQIAQIADTIRALRQLDKKDS